MKLGVVIVTYNRLHLLKECICACVNQTYKFEKIFIINNASTDGTKEYLNELKYENLEIIDSKENLGGAGGFSIGVEHSLKYSLDYLLLIDDDAILDKNYNEEIVKYMEKKDKTICAYSGIVKTNDIIQYEHRRHLLKGFKCVDSKQEEYQKEYFDYELSTFCGVYIQTSIIRKIGLPDKDFFIWFDDTEYSLRFREYGKIRNINKAWLDHKTVIAKDGGYNWKSYYGLRNQIVIIKRYFSKITLIKFIIPMLVMIFGGKVMRLIKNDLYYNEVSDIYKNALKDGMKNILGKNKKYLPGYSIKKSTKK